MNLILNTLMKLICIINKLFNIDYKLINNE